MEIEYIPITKSDVWSSTRTIRPDGLVLHSTAMPGYDAYAIQQNFNRPNRGASIHAAVDNVLVVQCLPWTKRAGHVGSGRGGSFNNSHIGVEMCEPRGITYNSNASAIISYNPPAGYFERIWGNAVELFAMLCMEYGLDPLGRNVIVSHAEAHALGYGDNHADPDHWLRVEGRTMDDFRRAVKARIDEKKEDEEVLTGEEIYYKLQAYLETRAVPAWALEELNQAEALAITDGSVPMGMTPRFQAAIMAKRAVDAALSNGRPAVPAGAESGTGV